MAAPAPRYVIIAAIEPSAASAQVLHTARAFAAVVAGAELHVAYVIEPGPAPHSSSTNEAVDVARAFLDQAVAEADGVSRVAAHLLVGAADERIVQLGADIGADLIVVGTHEKRGLTRILGSVSERVMRNARCAVLVARTKGEFLAEGPTIEPPCPNCLEVQQSTRGGQLWCTVHARRHVSGHLHHSASPGSLGGTSMFIRTEG